MSRARRPRRPDAWRARSTAPELMDDPSIGGPELDETLRQLTWLNRLLGGYAPSVDGVLALLGAARASATVDAVDGDAGADATAVRRRATLLDVGTGAADTPRRLVDAAARRDVVLSVTAIDLTAATVAHAQARCRGYPSIRVGHADLFALDPAALRFDVVHAALVVHHFDDDDAVRALARMYALADRGVVVNDLHRHPLAWLGIRLLTALVFRNRLIRHDAPQSVRRGFRAAELRALAARAGWPAAETRLRWWPLFRWQLVAVKAAGAPARRRDGP